MEVLVGPERRRRWTVAEKLAIVREAFAPGALVADVARRRDVSRAQVYQWRAALREGRLSEASDESSGSCRWSYRDCRARGRPCRTARTWPSRSRSTSLGVGG